MLSAIAPYFAVVVTVIVWALTQRANRKHEVFKERLKRRVEMFDGLLPEVANFVTGLKRWDNDKENEAALRMCRDAFNELGSYRIKIICYGTTEERMLYERLIDAIEKRDVVGLPDANNKLVYLVKQNLRKELGIKD
jgi:hypothetical protein